MIGSLGIQILDTTDSRLNYDGLAGLVEVFKVIVENPDWALAIVIFVGCLLVIKLAVIRFILHSLEVGDERSRAKASGAFWRTLFCAGALYLAYVFLFGTFLPPDLTPIVDLLQHLPTA